ncbi:hypothetical protein GIB67_009289 [Kingdonia uniflora]|uniref:No apical meristem-associated C-terminal domain-containing protein n=1 Tax=Kingdonia uniflora TaxID=39325 RepID=A0A7J7N306_9MAGN|nr:hypothetical protein GIB67_009289 [Kingdonia uniflora]
MANSGTSGNSFTPSTPSSQNSPSTPFAQHPSSQFTPYFYQNPSQFQPQFQSQTPPPFTMSQGDPSYEQYQSPFTLSQPQPQAFSPYYQPYPLTQPQGFQSPNYFQNYLFHGESTQHSQSDANASIPVEAAASQKEKGKGKMKRAPAKQRPSVQVSEDTEFLDETDDAGMHWTDADFTDPECPTRRSCGSTKSKWCALNAQCVAYKGIVAQERFRNSSGKIEEDRENDAHKINKSLNGGNDFKHREEYKILARGPRWANLRDDGLNHAVNIPRNVARRTSENSSPGNSVGSNNLSKDPDGPPTPQSAGPNSDLDGSLYEGGSRLIDQKLHRKHIALQKAMEGVTASGSGIQTLLDELRLEKMQTNQKKERRRAETIQHWQAKMDLEEAKEDHKIMEKDLSTLSGHQLQYYLQRQTEIMERLANRGGPGT